MRSRHADVALSWVGQKGLSAIQPTTNPPNEPHSASGPTPLAASPNERIINVRKLVAIDLVFHGPRFILIEFGAGIPFMQALGAFILWRGAQSGGAFVASNLLGAYLLSLACNYLPLLFYAVIFVRRGDAATVVAHELAHREHYVRRYSAQQALLLLPFFMLGLALWQAWQARR